MRQRPYPKRSWLMSWLHLPIDLWRIRQESPADATEMIKYIGSRRSTHMKSRPMQIILEALQKRAAEPEPPRGQIKKRRPKPTP